MIEPIYEYEVRESRYGAKSGKWYVVVRWPLAEGEAPIPPVSEGVVHLPREMACRQWLGIGAEGQDVYCGATWIGAAGYCTTCESQSGVPVEGGRQLTLDEVDPFCKNGRIRFVPKA